MTPGGAQIAHTRPYPGMRPFERNEAELFFGQEGQIAELVRRLGRSRLLAVLGESGCGKSSLVKAGMIPTVLGRRSPETALWRISMSQPGISPIRQLAEGLRASVCPSIPVDGIEAVLRSSSYGLMDLVQQSGLEPGHRVLIVIDQFEELFRLWRESDEAASGRDEAALFVKLLLAVADRSPQTFAIPIYVTLTMRSEYLGDCALFFGLAEAINDGAYLLPKMSRSNVEAAIVRPLELFNGTIENDLLQALLNEAEIAQQDGLPLLQHGLKRLWDRATSRSGPVRLTLADLRDVKESTPGALFLEKHLNAHLDSLLHDGLTDSQQATAQTLFRQLGDYDAKGRLIRRGCTLAAAVDVCRLKVAELLRVADAFRDDATGQSFLMPPRDRTKALLDGDASLGVCHEALLRHWARLGLWIDQEAKDADEFRALAARAVAVDKPPVLRGSEFARALALRRRVLTEAWSRRYQGPLEASGGRNRFDYAATMAYLNRSQRKQSLRFLGYALGALALIGGTALTMRIEVERQKQGVRTAALSASVATLTAARDEATAERNRATAARDEATVERNKATAARDEATVERNKATAARDEATAERNKATDERNRATAARDEATAEGNRATAARDEATAERNKATAARDEATTERNSAIELRKLAEKATEQNVLRLLAARAPTFDRTGTRAWLEELSASAKTYAAAYGQVPSTVLGALNRAVELSYLLSSDTRSGDPVLLVALPDPKTPATIKVIRRGMSPEDLSVPVERQRWNVQRGALVPGDKEVAVGGAGGYVAITELVDRKFVTRKLHPFAVTGLGFSTDGKWVATSSAGGDIRLLKHDDFHDRSVLTDEFFQIVNSTKLVAFLSFRRFKGDYAVRDLAISLGDRGQAAERRDVSVVGLTDTGRVILWQQPGPFGKQLSGVDSDRVAVAGSFTAVATNPASQEVWMARPPSADDPPRTAGSERATPEGDVGVFDMSRRRFAPCGSPTHGLPVSALAWNQRGDRLALGLRDGRVWVIAKRTASGCADMSREIDMPAHGTAVTTVSWHGDVLASGSSDGSARLWTMPRDTDGRQLLAILKELVDSSASSENWPAEPTPGAFQPLFQSLDRRLQDLHGGLAP